MVIPAGSFIKGGALAKITATNQRAWDTAAALSGGTLTISVGRWNGEQTERFTVDGVTIVFANQQPRDIRTDADIAQNVDGFIFRRDPLPLKDGDNFAIDMQGSSRPAWVVAVYKTELGIQRASFTMSAQVE